MTVEAEVAYFITDCTVLSAALIQQIATQFLVTLQSRGVCLDGAVTTCTIEDVTIDCGEVVESDPFGGWGGPFRRRRSTGNQLNELRVKFKMTMPEVLETEASCTGVCGRSAVSTEACLQRCEQTYYNSSTQVLGAATDRLQQLFTTVRVTAPTPAPTTRALVQARTFSRARVHGMTHSVSQTRPAARMPQTPAVVQDNGLTLRLPGLTLVPRQGLRQEQPIRSCASGMVTTSGNATCSVYHT